MTHNLYEFEKPFDNGTEFFRIEELPDRRLLRVVTYVQDGSSTTLDIPRQEFEKAMALTIMAEMEFTRRQLQASRDNEARLKKALLNGGPVLPLEDAEPA